MTATPMMCPRRPSTIEARSRAVATTIVITAMLALSIGWPPAPAGGGARGSSPRQQVLERFIAGDYAGALAMLEAQLQRAPDEPDLLYQAARASSRLGRRDRAIDFLRRAAAAGFREMDRARDDEDLQAIRDHPDFPSIIAAAVPASEPRHPADGSIADPLTEWRQRFGEAQYQYERDPTRKLGYATALDEASRGQMRQMLAHEADQLTATLFPDGLGTEVLIVIPAPRDADLLISDPRIGGFFLPASRRLIARNIGPTLRHEFVHAFHHSHMSRLGQRHRLWVQEGLASLYETYAIQPDGTFQFLPNERHNVMKAAMASRRLQSWSSLFDMPDDRFVAQGETTYPQVRSIFEFLVERGRLIDWYRAYVLRFDIDPSGSRAFDDAFASPVTEVEKQWRSWLMARPALDLSIAPGDAALGIEVSPDLANDGVIIERVRPGSAAARAELQAGDVIQSVDGRDAHTAVELISVIAARRPGDHVAIRFRRGDQRLVTIARLESLGRR